MSVLEARVRLRDGLRALHDGGRSLDEQPIASVVNELLDCCGSDHRPLVDLLRLVLRHAGPVRGAPLSAEEWSVVRSDGVTRLESTAFLEADAARWALETLYYATVGSTRYRSRRWCRSRAPRCEPSRPRGDRHRNQHA
jgi:hypothetical protein